MPITPMNPAAETEYDPTTGTLKEKAKKAGLPASPSSMNGADAVGATADQKKMIGTPNQLPSQFGTGTGESAAASTEAPPPPQPGAAPQTLAQADRTASFRATPTEADAQAQQRREEMKKAYGDVGLGVDNMIRAAIAKRTPATTGYKPDTTALDLLPEWAAAAPELKTAANTALAALAANPSDPTLYQAAQRALNAAGLPANQISDVLKQQSVGAVTAAQVADEVPVDMEALAGFGISPEDLALVGLTQEQVQGMTLAQFQTRLREGLQSNANQVAGLQAQLRDKNVDPNTKRSIQEQLRALGAVGGYASEQEIQGILDNQIADPSERIQIGTKDYSVEDLLDDDQMSGLIQEYLDSPVGSDVRKQLDGKFPELAKFIGENGETLKKASEALASTEGVVQKTQKENAAVMNDLSAAGVSSTDAQALLKSMFPEMGDQFSLNKIDVSKSGLLQTLLDPERMKKLPKGAREQTIKDIVWFTQRNPKMGTELAKLTADEVAKLGIFQNSEKWQAFKGSLREQRELSTLKPDELAKRIFGTSDMNSVWSQMQAMEAMGEYKNAGSLKKLLDASPKDGKPDSPEAIKKRIDAQFKKSPKSLRDLLKGAKPASLPNRVGKPSVGVAAYAAAAKDGKITSDELPSVFKHMKDSDFAKFQRDPSNYVHANAALVQKEKERRGAIRSKKRVGDMFAGVGLSKDSQLISSIMTSPSKAKWDAMVHDQNGRPLSGQQYRERVKVVEGILANIMSEKEKMGWDPALESYITNIRRMLKGKG